MAVIRNQSYVLHFYAYNSDGTPKTGDASNITVRIAKDNGNLTAATNTPQEVDATNAPGVYRITLTATEMDANSVLVVPKSSTSGVQCTVANIITERGVTTGIKAKTDQMTFTAGGYIYSAPQTGVHLNASEHDAIQSDVVTALTGQGYTAARANKLDNLDAAVTSRAAPGDAMTLTSAERTNIASAVWSHVIEGTYTAVKLMRLFASALLGKVSGAQNNQPVFRDLVDTKNRITMQVDNDGNRTSVTVDGD